MIIITLYPNLNLKIARDKYALKFLFKEHKKINKAILKKLVMH